MSKPAPIHKGKCPICGDTPQEAYRPFCSKHCADVDLGRWFSGAYAVPLVENDEDENENTEEPEK